jgi:hypothetical protein
VLNLKGKSREMFGALFGVTEYFFLGLENNPLLVFTFFRGSSYLVLLLACACACIVFCLHEISCKSRFKGHAHQILDFILNVYK